AEGHFAQVAADAAALSDQLQSLGVPDEAAAMAALAADAHLLSGAVAAAREAVERARSLLGASTHLLSTLPVEIAAARISAAERPRQLGAAVARLAALADAAAKAGLSGERWQARYAAAELELKAGRPGATARVAALA